MAIKTTCLLLLARILKVFILMATTVGALIRTCLQSCHRLQTSLSLFLASSKFATLNRIIKIKIKIMQTFNNATKLVAAIRFPTGGVWQGASGKGV